MLSASYSNTSRLINKLRITAAINPVHIETRVCWMRVVRFNRGDLGETFDTNLYSHVRTWYKRTGYNVLVQDTGNYEDTLTSQDAACLLCMLPLCRATLRLPYANVEHLDRNLWGRRCASTADPPFVDDCSAYLQRVENSSARNNREPEINLE